MKQFLQKLNLMDDPQLNEDLAVALGECSQLNKLKLMVYLLRSLGMEKNPAMKAVERGLEYLHRDAT